MMVVGGDHLYITITAKIETPLKLTTGRNVHNTSTGGEFMSQEFENHLTAAEVGVLWGQYTNTTLRICMLQYFLAVSEDQKIGQAIDFALQATQSKARRIREILKSDNYPVPIGFGDSDVNVRAPRLYSDPFALRYLRNTARIGLSTYGLSFIVCTRQDVRRHYSESITEAIHIDERAMEVEKAKGLYARPPYISAPEEPEFVQDSSFLGSILGDKRPLNAIEIANIFLGSQNNLLTTALLMGFAQAAEAKELREFFQRGKQIAHKHAGIFTALLSKDGMPTPASFGSYVTNSTIAPFSDKLMLQNAILLTQVEIGNYGTALAFIARTDLSGSYARLMTEMVQYLEDAEILLIRHKWMEQPPMAEDRRALVRR